MAEPRITDFIGDIIDSLRKRASIISITNIPTTTNYVCVVSDLLDLVIGNTVFIGGVEYTIDAIDIGTPSFTVSANSLPVGTEYKTGYPYYFHGTYLAIDNELKKITNSQKKYPIIYFAETFSDRENLNPLSQIGDTVTSAMYFMTSANFRDWLTEDHYDFVIDEIDELVTKFIAKLKSNSFIQYNELEEIERVRHAKWGLYVENKGHTTNLFTDNLSGVELRLTIPLRKKFNPCKYENIDFRNCAGVNIIENGIFIQTVPSGDSFSYSTTGGGDVEIDINGTLYSIEAAPSLIDIPVLNSDGNQIGTVNAGVQVNIEDSFVENTDASYTNQFASGTIFVLPNINLTQPNGDVELNLSMTDLSCTLIENLATQDLNDDLTPTQINQIQRQQPTRSGQVTSFRTGDDGDLEMGIGASFSILSDLNIFGTNQRFTDELGGQTYTNKFVLDHLTGLMWYIGLTTATQWNGAIDGALASTQGAFTDWILPNINQLVSICNFSTVTNALLNYSPFNIAITTSTDRIWTSTTFANTTANAYTLQSNSTFAGTGKSTSQSYIICRKFIPSDFGL
jgi:hypothetical protein